MSPSRGSEAKTAMRVPSSSSARPVWAASQFCRRCGGGQTAVQTDHPLPRKTRRKAGLELRCEIDLRHQHQHLLSARQSGLGCAQVNLRFAAACDAVQQAGARRRAVQLLQHLGLLGRQSGQGRWGVRRFRLNDRMGRQGIRCAQAAVQLLQAALQLNAIQLLQLGRQHRHGQLSRRALVVAGSELQQASPGVLQRRELGQDFGEAAQFGNWGDGSRPSSIARRDRSPRAVPTAPARACRARASVAPVRRAEGSRAPPPPRCAWAKPRAPEHGWARPPRSRGIWGPGSDPFSPTSSGDFSVVQTSR